MAKLDLVNVTNLQNETSAVNTINTNSARIEAAVENTLSRDGSSPNEMNANLDMNNNRIFNLPEAVVGSEPLRKQDADEILALADEFQAAIDATQGAVDAYESIQALYLGEKTTLPLVDNLGQPLQSGALVSLVDQVDPDEDGLYVYHDGSWGLASTLPTAFEREEHIIAVGGETIVNVPSGYTPGPTTTIFRNGVRQRQGTNLGTGDTQDDVTAADGGTLLWPSGVLQAGDVITVTVAKAYAVVSPVSASNVSVTPTGGISSTNAQTALAELDTEKVPKTTTITGGGLVTGGGDLSANRVVTVDAASDAEAIAGTLTTKVITPASLKAVTNTLALASAFVLVNSGTIGVAAPTLDIALSGGWRQFIIAADDFEPVTATQSLNVRLSFDGGATYESGASTYLQGGSYTNSSSTTYGSISASSTAFTIGRPQVASGGYGSLLWLQISSNNINQTRVNWTFGGTEAGPIPFETRGGGICTNVSAAPTHIRFLYGSGNIEAGTRWQIYGMRS